MHAGLLEWAAWLRGVTSREPDWVPASRLAIVTGCPIGTHGPVRSQVAGGFVPALLRCVRPRAPVVSVLEVASGPLAVFRPLLPPLLESSRFRLVLRGPPCVDAADVLPADSARIVVSVVISGPSRAILDAQDGDGAFEALTRGVPRLLERWGSSAITAVLPATPRSLDLLPDLARCAADLGCTRLEVCRLHGIDENGRVTGFEDGVDAARFARQVERARCAQPAGVNLTVPASRLDLAGFSRTHRSVLQRTHERLGPGADFLGWRCVGPDGSWAARGAVGDENWQTGSIFRRAADRHAGALRVAPDPPESLVVRHLGHLVDPRWP